jgi:hypothetical protein
VAAAAAAGAGCRSSSACAGGELAGRGGQRSRELPREQQEAADTLLLLLAGARLGVGEQRRCWRGPALLLLLLLLEAGLQQAGCERAPPACLRSSDAGGPALGAWVPAAAGGAVKAAHY